MNYVLLSLFLGMATACSLILTHQQLNTFEKPFITFILTLQFVAIISLYFNYKDMLFVTHVFYAITLLMGSIYAKNIYIILLLICVMCIAKICVCCIGDCPYHSCSKRLRYGGGGETDNILYGVCLCILIYRYIQ